MRHRKEICVLVPLLVLGLILAGAKRITQPATLQTITVRLPLSAWAQEQSASALSFTGFGITGLREIGGLTACAAPAGTDPDDLAKAWNSRDMDTIAALFDRLEILPAEDSGMGYMLSNDTRGGWQADIFPDEADALQQLEGWRHIFFLDGTIIYDLWLDKSYMESSQIEKIANSAEFA